MLARAVKPNCDGLHDVAKQLLIWTFKGKRKFNTKNSIKFYEHDENRNDSHQSFRKRNHGKFRNDFDLNSPKTKKIKWNEIELATFEKNFYTPHENVLNRSPTEVNEFLRKYEIKIRGRDCPAPILSFEETGLSQSLINLIRKYNYSEPTPIQAQGMPIALSGRNMVGIARTGSGKTLAFILPAIIHVLNQPKLKRFDGPIALVIAPTRELVQQIQNVADPFTRASNLKSVSVYGGSNRTNQVSQLRRAPEICVATPGRLLDFLNAGITNLERCTYLVLDEADRMFDMGFEPQIRSIIEQIRPDRQVLMWSATWPREIQELAEEYLEDYIQLKIGSTELTANPNINQIVHVCDEKDKRQLLKKVMNDIVNEEENKTLIFASTKMKADDIAYWLNSVGLMAKSLHGGKTQTIREIILRDFRRGKISVLVATDVAARGLDVSDIRFVINYDHPSCTEDYIHRIGRTGRHNSKGTSYSFLTSDDAPRAKELISVLKDANQNVQPDLVSLAHSTSSKKNFRGFRGGGFYRSYNSYNRPIYRRNY